MDRLDLNERYGRALKACHYVSAFHSFPPHFSFSSLFFDFVFYVLLFFSFFFVGGFYLSHNLCDFSGTSAAQAEMEKLKGELRLGQSREEKLGRRSELYRGAWTTKPERTPVYPRS